LWPTLGALKRPLAQSTPFSSFFIRQNRAVKAHRHS
jgi:hypothetical protein